MAIVIAAAAIILTCVAAVLLVFACRGRIRSSSRSDHTYSSIRDIWRRGVNQLSRQHRRRRQRESDPQRPESPPPPYPGEAPPWQWPNQGGWPIQSPWPQPGQQPANPQTVNASTETPPSYDDVIGRPPPPPPRDQHPGFTPPQPTHFRNNATRESISEVIYADDPNNSVHSQHPPRQQDPLSQLNLEQPNSDQRVLEWNCFEEQHVHPRVDSYVEPNQQWTWSPAIPRPVNRNIAWDPNPTESDTVTARSEMLVNRAAERVAADRRRQRRDPRVRRSLLRRVRRQEQPRPRLDDFQLVQHPNWMDLDNTYATELPPPSPPSSPRPRRLGARLPRNPFRRESNSHNLNYISPGRTPNYNRLQRHGRLDQQAGRHGGLPPPGMFHGPPGYSRQPGARHSGEYSFNRYFRPRRQ